MFYDTQLVEYLIEFAPTNFSARLQKFMQIQETDKLLCLLIWPTRVVPLLRMYCLDTPGVPKSSDAGTFHCL